MYSGKHIEIKDFSGGFCQNIRPDLLQLNQAKDCVNIVVLPEGKGFRSRDANTTYTSLLNGGARVMGFNIFYSTSGTRHFTIVCGDKIYRNSSATPSTFTNATGAVVVTALQTDSYQLFTFGSNVIGFGGSYQVPWEIEPIAGTAAYLTGTPPSALGGFTANNRVFAYNTSSARSTLYWSVLANENDWTGSGSGSAVIGSSGSVDSEITAAAQLNTNTCLIFKKTQVYQLVLTAAPFPNYLLFDGVGCVGKQAVVNIDGAVYWINQYGRMCSTTGNSVITYPTSADNLWDTMYGLQSTTAVGFRQKGVDYDWLVWTFAIESSGSNVQCIVWDLINKCWLRNSNYEFGIARMDQTTGLTWAGTDLGSIIQVGQTRMTSADTFNAYWQSGWIQPSTSEEIIQPNRFTLNVTPTNATVTLNYGFNFIVNQKTATINCAAVSTEAIRNIRTTLTGRGNYFNFELVGAQTSTAVLNVSSIVLSGKVYGQKRQSAS